MPKKIYRVGPNQELPPSSLQSWIEICTINWAIADSIKDTWKHHAYGFVYRIVIDRQRYFENTFSLN